MKELMLEVEALEERIAPCCCDPSLISVQANPTVNASNSNVAIGGPQTAVNTGSGSIAQNSTQTAGSFNSVSTYAST